tara:strand:+ start:1528 stop:2052 length:525 start_codon:yes stop_codon:yes gene_type:complete
MIIYLDMDGVLADFFGALATNYNVKHWKDIPHINQTLTELKGTDFFNRIEPFDSTYNVVGYVKELTHQHQHLQWGINSSPLRDDRDNSAYWKRVWLTRHNIMPDVQNLVFTATKEKYAVNYVDGTPNILVDDKPSNIKKWIDANGLGILWQANRDSLNTLEIELDKAIKIGEKV